MILLVVILVLVMSASLAVFAYRSSIGGQLLPLPTIAISSPTPATPTPTPAPTFTVIGTETVSTLPPVKDWRSILGVNSDPYTSYPNIPWVRLSYPTCGYFHLNGEGLRHTVNALHNKGVRIMFVICQQSGKALLDPAPFNDVATSGVDAVQCGNEEMKYNPGVTLYVKPADFAKFYDLCEHTIHAARSNIPVLLGSLDPHVGGIDYGPLQDQVSYLDQMQSAMNTSVHPGGNWQWRSQILGLIDSWHNGYPTESTNSLYNLFVFWAQQFGIDLNSGQLGKHLWVTEGTACYRGCGLDQNDPSQIAIAHILSLITNVQTSMRYGVPFFQFSGKDYLIPGGVAPTGVLDLKGHSKPLRQDLSMGARSLVMSCPTGQVTVVDQEQLLAKLYARCSPPANYRTILTS